MKKKKMAAVLLALCMTGGMLAGCGGAQEGQENAASVTEAPASQEAEQEKGEAEGEAAQTDGDVRTVDLYINFSWYSSDNWEGIIPEEITAKTGVEFNVTRAVDGSQLGLMIASGELPDVIFCTDESLDRLCDSKLCYSYNELIEQYGIDWQPDEERIAIARTHNADPEDENYYTILQNYNTAEEWESFSGGVPQIPGMYYRKDIWEELGSPEMNTLEQVKSVMAMVKEKYPEMQVLNAGNASWRLRGVGSWFGVSIDFQYADDGSVAYTETLPEFYDYMKCVNEFYRNGYFPEENLALTVEDDAYQQANSGQCFMYEWNARTTTLDQLNSGIQANDPDAEWAFLPILDDGKEIAYANAGWAGMFISKSCKDPEAAIRIISYLSSEEGRHLSQWGREGIEYTLDENGIPQFSDEWKETNKDGAKMASTYNTNFFCTTELDELSCYYSGRTEEEVEMFGKNLDKVVFYPELALSTPKATTDMGIAYSKIKEARDAERVKMYTAASEEEFEAAYQSYMELLDKMGVQDLNAYMNDSVKEIQEKFGF